MPDHKARPPGAAARALMRSWPKEWRRGAQRAIDFFETKLRLVKGRAAGKPYLLPEWFELLIRRVFGPLNPDGTRTCRTFYLEVGRKNSKSTGVGGLALYMLAEDNEAGAEVYTAAHDRKQAKIVFNSARAMALRSRYLNQKHGGKLTILTHIIEGVDDELTKLEAISSDSGGQQGLDPHCVVLDELHVLTRELVEVLDSASGSRSQPLTVMITTAGEYDPESVAWEKHEYARGVIDGTIVDPAWVAAIYSVPTEDDISDESVWAKANPNLGVSVHIDYLRAQYRKAQKNPQTMAAFRRYHMNQWVTQINAWIHMSSWAKCEGAVDLAALQGQVCCSGLDLSTNRDLTAHVLAFPRPDGIFDVVARLFMPTDRLVEMIDNDGVPYDAWVRDGWITLTPGNSIDLDFIERSILQDFAAFQLREMAYDRWGATHISQRLELQVGRESSRAEADQLKVVQFGQGFASMTEPTKDLQELIESEKLRTGGNPVLRWMASCCSTIQDTAGNVKLVKPDRRKHKKRIDGIVALVMAMARAKHHKAVIDISGDKSTSIYETEGVFIV